MKQVLQNMRTGKTTVEDVPIPSIQPNTALIRTATSLVSAGTERSVIAFAEKNILAKAQSRPDLLKQVLEKAKREGILATIETAISRLDQPLTLGYSSAGTIVEVGEGTKNFKPGDRVVCIGGGFAVHAEYAIVPQTLMAHLPDEVSFEEGAFAGLGSIAIHGIRLAQVQIGEKIAVIGLGLLGLLTSQLLQVNGCSVYGFDLDLDKIKIAKSLHIQAAANAQALKKVSSFTKSRGFDAVLICAATSSNDTVELAGEIARDRARIISLGVVGLDLPRKLYFEKELFFQVSRSSGPGRYDHKYENAGQDYPIGYVRWTEGRNLEAFVDILRSKKININSLVTHHFPIENATQAYHIITGKTEDTYLGILIEFEKEQAKPKKILHFERSGEKEHKDKLGIGIIGAGNYANNIFLPIIKNNSLSEMRCIISKTGVSAAYSAKKFNIPKAVTTQKNVLLDPSIDVIVILTRHHLHAETTIKALKKGKHVYCEKPLAINEEDLRKIERLLSQKNTPHLMVGFNRRFAPLAVKLKKAFQERDEPLFSFYRVNAGYLPVDHWLHNPAQGGGRIIGEGCHFIDFLTFLVGSVPISVNTQSLPDQGKYHQDNVLITLHFQDGSIGQIAYLSNGNKLLPKEYIEVFCEGQTARLDDYRHLEIIKNGKRTRYKNKWRQDKGHQNAWNAFIEGIHSSTPPPIPYEELITVSQATLAAQKSLTNGKSISLEK